jgi:hypothetical protein
MCSIIKLENIISKAKIDRKHNCNLQEILKKIKAKHCKGPISSL